MGYRNAGADPPTPSAVRSTAVASAATVVGGLPAFITGVMAVQVTRDLGFGLAGLGSAVTIYYATGAVAAVPLGRLADRIGATLSLRLATAGAAAASLGVAVAVHSWVALASCLAIAGVSHALGQPAANRLLVNRVPAARLGTAFGFKQSAPPIASALAGFSIPAVALTVGWRWAYVLSAGAAVAVMLSVGRRAVEPRVGRRRGKRTPLRNRSTIVVLTIGFGLAFGANSVMLAFYVDAAVAAGLSQRSAGVVFAVASVGAIVTRLIAGAVCDRTSVEPMYLSGILVGLGSVGVLLLAVGQPATMAVGILVALGLTWGFPGVFWLALVRTYPVAPGRITGALALGGFGAVLAPLLFGVVVERAGYPPAWTGAAVMALASSGTMLFGVRRLAAPQEDVP